MKRNIEERNRIKGMSQRQADFLLVLVTLGWGISYIFMDFCLETFGPFTLNMYRFLIASVLAYVIRRKYINRTINRNTVKWGIIIGILLFLVYACTTFGIRLTTVSNTGFLCAMTVVFTPFFSAVFFRKIPDFKTVTAIVFCFIGMAMLTIGDNFAITSDSFKGDMLCVMCGFFYAFDLLVTEVAVKHDDVDAYTLGTIQLFTVGILNLIGSLLTENTTVVPDLKTALAALFLSLFSTGFAFIVQPIAQKYTTASRVGLIFTLEPVFNVVAAYFILHEVLNVRGYIGSAIMIASLVIMEIDFNAKRKVK